MQLVYYNYIRVCYVNVSLWKVVRVGNWREKLTSPMLYISFIRIIEYMYSTIAIDYTINECN